MRTRAYAAPPCRSGARSALGRRTEIEFRNRPNIFVVSHLHHLSLSLVRHRRRRRRSRSRRRRGIVVVLLIVSRRLHRRRRRRRGRRNSRRRRPREKSFLRF